MLSDQINYYGTLFLILCLIFSNNQILAQEELVISYKGAVGKKNETNSYRVGIEIFRSTVVYMDGKDIPIAVLGKNGRFVSYYELYDSLRQVKSIDSKIYDIPPEASPTIKGVYLHANETSISVHCSKSIKPNLSKRFDGKKSTNGTVLTIPISQVETIKIYRKGKNARTGTTNGRPKKEIKRFEINGSKENFDAIEFVLETYKALN